MRYLANFYKLLCARFIGKRLYPIKLTCALTYRCNSRCRTCNIWKNKENWRDISSQLLHTVLNHFKRSLIWLDFTGGEIHLIEGLPELIVTAVNSSRVTSITLTTNGLLSEKAVEDVRSILNRIDPSIRVIYSVSMDGKESLHDYIRGIKGAFKRCWKTFKSMLEVEKKYSNFETCISYTISQYNCGHLSEFIDYLEENDISPERIKITVEHARSYYGKEGETIDWDIKRLQKDIRAFLSVSRQEKRDLVSWMKDRFYFSYANGILPFIEGKGGLSHMCKAGVNSLYLDPRGRLFICMQWNYEIGRVDSHGKIEIDLNKLRLGRSLIKRDQCPNCWTPCETQVGWIVNLPVSLFLTWEKI